MAKFYHIGTLRGAIVTGALLAALSHGAHAQTAAPVPPPDPATIITLQTENDVVGRTDRNYTAGLRLGITLPTGLMPDFVSELGRSVMGDGQQRISLDVAQALFTPRNTTLATPNPNDRPYAAILTAQLNLVHDTDNARTILGLGLGVLGPAALGEELQNGFHNLIGENTAKGWGAQVRNMPVVQLTAARIWRLPVLGNALPIQMDLLPSVAGAVGTWRDYARVGLQLRIGQGLDSDFGTSRISPGLTGADAYTPTRGFVWYVFAGADGQAIAWDATLDGNPFRSGPHVSRNALVGEMEAGFALIYAGLRFSYTHVLQTQEFRGQRGGLVQFGSFSVAARF